MTQYNDPEHRAQDKKKQTEKSDKDKTSCLWNSLYLSSVFSKQQSGVSSDVFFYNPFSIGIFSSYST